MNKCLHLHIDETGVSDVNNNQSNLYVLCGGVILQDKKADLKIYADKVKFKYFGNDQVILHSAEIAKDLGAFSILKNNPQLKSDFLKDLFTLLNSAPIIIFPIFLDKLEIKKRRWGQKRILTTLSRNLFQNFILHVLSKDGFTGKIIIESSNVHKDFYYNEALSHFMANGISSAKIEGKEVRNAITSLSYVTKQNDDIETQIVDLLAFGAKCEYEIRHKLQNFLPHSYEYKIAKCLRSKLFVIHSNTGIQKRAILNNINTFQIVP